MKNNQIKRKFIEDGLKNIQEYTNFSLSSLERIFDLDVGEMEKWKDSCSSSDYALLKLLVQFPYLIKYYDDKINKLRR